MTPNLIDSWQQHIGAEFDQPYMQQLKEFLTAESAADKQIFPAASQVFNAFNHCALENIKVVILGQDPYHGPDQAHGLSFSVPRGIRTPPSLVNIYKELHSDIGIPIPGHGNLESWAEQGVFLLNSVLTVSAGQAASHQKQGWEQFTDHVIHQINDKAEHVVFLLWGSYAQKKANFVDQSKHLVLTSVHPSPLSAYRGFLGCKHFSQANEWLIANGQKPIFWASVSDA